MLFANMRRCTDSHFIVGVCDYIGRTLLLPTPGFRRKLSSCSPALHRSYNVIAGAAAAALVSNIFCAESDNAVLLKALVSICNFSEYMRDALTVF